MKKIAKIKPFFIEIILVAFILTICAGVLIKLFGVTASTSQYSTDMNHAMFIAQEQLEKFSACENANDVLNTFSDIQNKVFDDKYIVYADITQQLTDNGNLSKINIKVFKIGLKENKELFDISTEKYFSDV